MRNELEYLAEIENYLLNPNASHTAFKLKMQNDAALREDVEAIHSVILGVEAKATRQEITRAKTNYRLMRALKFLSVILTISVATFAAIVIYNNLSGNKFGMEIRTKLPATNEIGGTEWIQADSVLPYLIYSISGDKDEVIETPEGIIFSIPKGSFRYKNGEVVTGIFELEIKEAMNAADIMKAGLSTWNDTKLLETGGMFYINARKDGENLQIPKGANITASIPKLQDRNDMMLFDGVRKMNSGLEILSAQPTKPEPYINQVDSKTFQELVNTASTNNYKPIRNTVSIEDINWINPRKPISDIISVPMEQLNFYPPNFEKTLVEAGYPDKSKTFKDSAYLSFKIEKQPVYPQAQEAPPQYVEWTAEDGTKTIDYSEKHYMPQNFQNKGKKLFDTHCQRCHYISHEKHTGPGLSGVRSRWDSEEKLVAWVQNSGKVLATGDKYASELYNLYNKTTMPSFPQLSQGDVISILDYIDENNIWINNGINPVNVLAFWNKEFNQTILSTREFEKRMYDIHRTCNEEILNCYTKNLDRPLYYCDSLAATKSYGDEQIRFQKYYSEGLGKPLDAKKITSALLHAFTAKQRQLDAVYERTTGEWFRKQAQADGQAMKQENNHNNRDVNRDGHNFDEEFNTNLREANRQLGKSSRKVFYKDVRQNYNTFHIATTGWKNVDAFAFEATVNRTSTNYTDPETGKTATLTYTELKLSIVNISEFDITEAYLIPNGKMSFIRMRKQNGNYTESLNSLYQYHLVAVGYKGKEVASFTEENITTGSLNITLQPSTTGAINQFIQRNASQRASDDFFSELKYLDFKTDEIKRNAERLKVEQLREVLMPIVFPCGTATADSVNAEKPLQK